MFDRSSVTADGVAALHSAAMREMPDMDMTSFGPIGGSHKGLGETHRRKRDVVTVRRSAFWRKADISNALADVC